MFAQSLDDARSGAGELAAATGFGDPGDLSFLDVLPRNYLMGTPALKGAVIAVIGGGPTGMVFAREAAVQGARVTLLEKVGDPRSADAVYTNRSFNITLNNIGRHILGESGAWQGGVDIIGRAIHATQGSDEVWYADYGPTPDYRLVSIPRSTLRRNMLQLALAAATHVEFNAEVVEFDPDGGAVTYNDAAGRRTTLQADLIVVADGLHSMADDMILSGGNAERYVRAEARSCVSAMLSPTDARSMSPHHLHLWHELASGSFVVGIPNQDGSVALLLASDFADIGVTAHPFATPELAAARLQRDFPQLYKRSPQLAHILPKHRRYRFHYKRLSSVRLGRCAAIVGDAGCAVPPWAGFGANSGMYAAASLVYQLVRHNLDIDTALNVYQAQQQRLSIQLMEYVRDQAEFLSGPVVRQPSLRPDTMLGELIRSTLAKSNPLAAIEKVTAA